MPTYFLRIPLSNPSFRLPSLYSIADLYGFEIRILSSDPLRSILVVELDDEKHLDYLLERGIMIMYAAELFAEGSSYNELHTQLKGKMPAFDPYMHKSFKISVEYANYHPQWSKQREVVESFSYLDLKGDIKMKDAEVDWVVFEDYDLLAENSHLIEAHKDNAGQFERVYFGRRIGYSRARGLIGSHAVRTRHFYGNTSMEAEMGFLMAGQALPSPGKIIYDPCAGTGSMLYACAHWGAYVYGSDIDGRQMRGKAKGKETVPGIMRAATQYGLADKVLDLLTSDFTRHPLRRGGWIDAIVTDPPYGVRAGAKRLGKRETRKKPVAEEPVILANGRPAHTEPGYIPPSRPYILTHLTLDLIRLARYLLVPGGRLVFFLPTTSEEYARIKLPHVYGMKEINKGGESIQDFGSWGRRLITMEKIAQDDGDPPTFSDYSAVEPPEGGQEFRDKYWAGFGNKSGTANAYSM